MMSSEQDEEKETREKFSPSQTKSPHESSSSPSEGEGEGEGEGVEDMSLPTGQMTTDKRRGSAPPKKLVARRVSSESSAAAASDDKTAKLWRPMTEEEKKMKRIFANRRSARASRERRLKRIATLEATVDALSMENKALARENEKLHRQVLSLLCENETLYFKGPAPLPPPHPLPPRPPVKPGGLPLSRMAGRPGLSPFALSRSPLRGPLYPPPPRSDDEVVASIERRLEAHRRRNIPQRFLGKADDGSVDMEEIDEYGPPHRRVSSISWKRTED